MEKFTLDFPLTRTHCGIAMGNGNFGALVWGRERLHVTVNRADFWDHRGGELILPGTTYKNLVEVANTQDRGKSLHNAIPRESFPGNVFKPQRLPVGRFEFGFKDGTRPLKAILEYGRGTLSIDLSNGGMIQLDLDIERSLILLRDPEANISDVTTKPSWDFPQSREWLEKYDFAPPSMIEEGRIKGWVQPCPSGPSLACLCASLDCGYAIALELGGDNRKAIQTAKSNLEKIDTSKLIQTNYEWWQNYWDGIPDISIPDEFMSRFYKYAMYKFAAATSPRGYPCGLQGPWHEEYQRAQWSGDYHFNVNVQQIYSLAFPAGKLEHLKPLFDMLESESFQKCLRHNAKVMFGIDDGLWFTHAVDDRGYQCGWLDTGSILDPACGAWTAQLYWLYYQYSGDMEFLRKRAFPFIQGISRGYEEMLEEYQGRLSIPLSISAEYGCSNPAAGSAGRDPSYQLAAVHMLVDYLIESCRILSLEPKDIWMDIKQRLPRFTAIEGKDSSGKTEKRIAIWEGQDLDVCHRHHAHLGGIYPFGTLNAATADEEETINNSIDHWILMGMGQWSEWCIPWAVIIYSRLGFSEAPMILFRTWQEIFVNEGLATVYLPRSRGVIAHRRHDLKKPKESSEIMQLDGTMGAATALLEMLILEKGGIVKLFQGIPEKWRDVSFKNICLPGGFRISAERKGGRICHLHVKSRFGGKLKIEVEGQIKELDFQHREERDIFQESLS